ncbi:MAG TPA: hypothetical protein PKJ99_02305 [Thermoanaerobaculales bacterium]|nr:hypothetical protein [Thermoanaerobaculales bacterium]HQL30320.1 hypothetical protein [Thermoanaerobaculales bacterium]
MTPYTVATAKVAIAGALAGLLVASYLLERGVAWRRRAFTTAFALVLAASALAYVNLGRFRWDGGLINAWEQYHFFLGSKYLPELRYDGLYDATVAAMADRYHVPKATKVRDLTTFELRPAHTGSQSVEAARARFDPARWQAFSDDVVAFFRPLGLPFERVIRDHGNTGSPSWAVLARVFTAGVAASARTLSWLSFLDLALLLALAVAIARAFSLRAMCIAMSIALLVPNAYDFLGGSILRLDWLVALGAAACLLERKRDRAAGVFLAWAIASKPFCALFAVSLGAHYAIGWWRTRRLARAHLELAAWTTVALVVIVALSAALLGGPSIWFEYGARIHLNLLEKYYAINYSFRDVFLQLAHEGPAAVLDWTPAAVAASLPEVEIGDFALSFGLARAALLALLAFVISRHDDEAFAFGMGAFFVYVVFVTNMYYWQMLLLPALAFAHSDRRDWRGLVDLLACCGFLAAAHLFARSGSAPHLEGFVGSWLLASFCALMITTEAAAALIDRARGRNRGAANEAGVTDR